MVVRVLLLLSVLLSAAFSQGILGGSSKCLCLKTRDNLGVHPRHIENIEIFPPSNFCENLEIIINLKNGLKYCLNPEAQKIRQILSRLKSRKRL